MADIYLYGGAANLNDIILRDPTILAVIAAETAAPAGGAGGITSSTKRKPAVYVDGIRRVQRELKQIKSFEELKRALEPQKAVETAPPLLIVSLPIDPEELRAKEIERQLQMMRDDDEAVALLLLN